MLETAFNQKLSLHARHSFKEARDITRYTRHETIEPEHLLLAIFLENGSLGSILLENIGFEKERLAKLCLKKKSKGKILPSTRTLPLSPSLKNILRRAYLLASEFNYPYVGTEHLVYALMESEHAAIEDILLSLEIEEKKIYSTLEAHLNFDHFPQLGKMLDLPEGTSSTKHKALGSQAASFLSQFTIDMGEKSEEQQEVFVGREKELARMIQVLTRKNKNNPLLIGDPGVGKTALVSALEQKIRRGEVPHALIGKRILSLDLTLIVAGTNFRGEFEARLKEIIQEASRDKNIVLFIDEIHTIVGAGNTSGGLDAANILKPALSRGEIRVIGATTLTEYKRHIEKDPALERRFQSIMVAEPTPDEAKHILLDIKSGYETFHHISLTPAIIDRAVDLSVRYISDRFLPDKALDIIDEASALAKHGQDHSSSIQELFRLEKMKQTVTLTKESLIKNERYDEAAKQRAEEKIITEQIANLKKKHHEESTRKRTLVTDEHLLQTISQMTNIPFAKLSEEKPREKLIHLRTVLEERLIGQKEIIESLEQTLARSLSNISDPDRPLGSFLFLGPTGVGKTLISKILAEEFFGDKSALIRLDMSEFMERHSVAQILGSPAGYIGYGDGGKLTETIRRKPYSVVLFDEIEKAHPDVFNILLQILDEGTLTDAEGRKVSFKNALIILTSNIGTTAFTQTAKIGFDKHIDEQGIHEQFNAIKREVLLELKKEMRPELLARLDHTLVFNALTKASILDITKLEMARFTTRLKGRGVTLRYPAAVTNFIAKKSFSPEQGARLIRKNIQEFVEKVVAEKLIHTPETKALRLTVKNDTLGCLP